MIRMTMCLEFSNYNHKLIAVKEIVIDMNDSSHTHNGKYCKQWHE